MTTSMNMPYIEITNAKFKNPNVKSMLNIKCPNERKVHPAVRSPLVRCYSRQVSGICLDIDAFGFHLTFGLCHLSFLCSLSQIKLTAFEYNSPVLNPSIWNSHIFRISMSVSTICARQRESRKSRTWLRDESM